MLRKGCLASDRVPFLPGFRRTEISAEHTCGAKFLVNIGRSRDINRDRRPSSKELIYYIFLAFVAAVAK